MKISNLLFVVQIFVGFFSYANERSLFESVAGMEVTSDRIEQSVFDLSWKQHRRDIFWSYLDEAPSAWDYGARIGLRSGKNLVHSYDGVRGQVLFGRKFTNTFHTELWAGMHRLHRAGEAPTSKNIAAVDWNTNWAMTEYLTMALHLGNDFIYQNLVQPGGTAEFISARSLDLDFQWRAAERVRVVSRNAAKSFDDRNFRLLNDLAVMYGIYMGTPWVWTGLGAERIIFTRQRVGTYWSPAYFMSVGPRFEGVVPLGTSGFQAALGLNLSLIHEKAAPWGFAYYASSKVIYGDRNSWNAFLDFTKIRSKQSQSVWKSDALSLGVNGSF